MKDHRIKNTKKKTASKFKNISKIHIFIIYLCEGNRDHCGISRSIYVLCGKDYRRLVNKTNKSCGSIRVFLFGGFFVSYSKRKYVWVFKIAIYIFEDLIKFFFKNKLRGFPVFWRETDNSEIPPKKVKTSGSAFAGKPASFSVEIIRQFAVIWLKIYNPKQNMFDSNIKQQQRKINPHFFLENNQFARLKQNATDFASYSKHVCITLQLCNYCYIQN